MVKTMGLGVIQTYEGYHCVLLAEWPQKSYLLYLSLNSFNAMKKKKNAHFALQRLKRWANFS